MIKKRAIQELPIHIKKFISIYNDAVNMEILECLEKNDMYELGVRYPFESSVMKKLGPNKNIEGYYMISLFLPTVADDIKVPVLAYYHMSSHDYDQDWVAIKAEMERRKKMFLEHKQDLKNLGTANQA